MAEVDKRLGKNLISTPQFFIQIRYYIVDTVQLTAVANRFLRPKYRSFLEHSTSSNIALLTVGIIKDTSNIENKQKSSYEQHGRITPPKAEEKDSPVFISRRSQEYISVTLPRQ